jgi:hypothetical protein
MQNVRQSSNSHLTIHQSLQIIPRIPFSRPDILSHISPESQHHVNNNWGAHCKDGGIHKILPDFTRSNAHPVADS